MRPARRRLLLGRTSQTVVLGSGAVPDAPVLTWDGDTADATPDFEVTFSAPEVGDVITLQWDTVNTFPAPSSTTNTLDASEVAAQSAAFATGALANGTYYFRAKHSRGAVDSAWSNTVTVAISVATGPTIVRQFTSTTPDTWGVNHPISVPSGVASGNLLLAVVVASNNALSSVPSGFTLVTSNTTNGTPKCYVYKKTADGTEGGTSLTWTLAGFGMCLVRMYEIDCDNLSVETSGWTVSAGNNDPAAVSPAAAPNDYIVIAACANQSNLPQATAGPSGYSDFTYSEATNTNDSSGSVCGLATANKSVTIASSENPGTFTYTNLSTNLTGAITIAVR